MTPWRTLNTQLLEDPFATYQSLRPITILLPTFNRTSVIGNPTLAPDSL